MSDATAAETAEHRPAKNFVRMFKPRFAAAVEAGTKRQTVRPMPKRMPRRGDTISLRCWIGAPYRSKQRVLREAKIERVAEIVIAADEVLPIKIRPMQDDRDERRYLNLSYSPTPDDFARADGFADWTEMREWFAREHGLPFAGIVIFWDAR